MSNASKVVSGAGVEAFVGAGDGDGHWVVREGWVLGFRDRCNLTDEGGDCTATRQPLRAFL